MDCTASALHLVLGHFVYSAKAIQNEIIPSNSFQIPWSSSCKWKPRCHPTPQLCACSTGKKHAESRQESFQVSLLFTVRDDEAAIASHFPAKAKQEAPILMAWVTGRAVLREKFTFVASKCTLHVVFCVENMASWLCKAECQYPSREVEEWYRCLPNTFADHKRFCNFSVSPMDGCVDPLSWAGINY